MKLHTFHLSSTLAALSMLSFMVLPAYAAPYDKAIAYWTDPDTPEAAKTVVTSTGVSMILVASDEFNQDGRAFDNGKDKMWTALDTPDVTNNAVEYAHPSMATTKDGNLVLTLSDENRGGRAWTGAILQTWNKFCFTGGFVETRNQWPKEAGTWPGAWMIGNLARPQYEKSAAGMWPFSYNTCDAQARKYQKINACLSNPGPGLNPNQGRGAPELDILEAWGDANGRYFFPASLQIAPSLPEYFRPLGDSPPTTAPNKGSWYKGITYGHEINRWYGHDEKGYWSNAVAGSRQLTATERNAYNTYQVEWKLGPDGYVKFLFNGNDLLVGIPASSIGNYCDPNNPSDCSGVRLIPEEPMSFILNMALAPSWAGGIPSATPSNFLVDYVRWYQPSDEVNIGCDPPKYPTKEYIAANADIYGPPVKPVPPATAQYAFYAASNSSSGSPTNSSSSSSSSTSDSSSPSTSDDTSKPTTSDSSSTSPSKSSDSSQDTNQKSEGFFSFFTNMSTAAQIGTIVGVCAGLIAIVTVVTVLVIKRMKKNQRAYEEEFLRQRTDSASVSFRAGKDKEFAQL